MIKHIVMWRVVEQNKQAAISQIKQALESLPEKITQIKSFEVGINVASSDRAADVVLVSLFNSLEELSLYQQHPEHVKVGMLIKQLTTEGRVVDYEVD